MNAQTKPPWMSATEVADRLDLNVNTVYRHARAGRFHAIRMGRKVRFSTEEIERILREGAPLDAAPIDAAPIDSPMD